MPFTASTVWFTKTVLLFAPLPVTPFDVLLMMIGAVVTFVVVVLLLLSYSN